MQLRGDDCEGVNRRLIAIITKPSGVSVLLEAFQRCPLIGRLNEAVLGVSIQRRLGAGDEGPNETNASRCKIVSQGHAARVLHQALTSPLMPAGSELPPRRLGNRERASRSSTCGSRAPTIGT